MKVNELKIGDWVQNEDGSIKGRIVNIDVPRNRVEFSAHTIDAEFVYPLRLPACACSISDIILEKGE